MNKKYIEEFREDLREFKEVTEKFYNKEVSIPEYKSFSGGFGSYAQRGGERSMLRLRMTAGDLDKNKLKFLVEGIKKYDVEKAHFTTCQSVQLHNLTKAAVCGLIEETLDYGIITRGGGGDFPRNIMCSPLSGVEQGEYFDVMPYAKEAGDYLLSLIKKVKLPRKLKVCFSNSKENRPHATFRDMGFVAKENKKFDVYIAGGLGNKPKFGVLAAEDVEPDKVLYCIKTMVDVFTKYGNYTQRAASRTRFLQDTLGAEELVKIYKETLEKNIKSGGLDIELSKDDTAERLDAKAAKSKAGEYADNKKVISQKQSGLYAVEYHPVGGTPDITFFETLYNVIKDMEEVSVRLLPEEGIYIINLSADEVEKILDITADYKGTEFEKSTACIGADVCQVGIGRSQILLNACMDAVKKENFADGVLPAIHISGCPSSCSAHQTATIGLRGGKKPTPEGPKYSFTMYENGCALQGEERFGDEIATIIEDNIPDFFVALGKEISAEKMTYKEFRNAHPDRIKELAQQF